MRKLTVCAVGVVAVIAAFSQEYGVNAEADSARRGSKEYDDERRAETYR